MKYFLDTNICIYYLKGQFPQLRKKLLDHNPETIGIPAIVKAELLYGAAKSKKSEDTLEQIKKFLLPYKIIDFTDAETPEYAAIRSELEASGNVIGPNDLFIASIVLSHKGILVTRNTKEFSRIEGLAIENWTE